MIADWDNDGDKDIFTAHKGKFYFNDGVGNFSLSYSLPHREGVRADAADLNGDGYLDIMLSGGNNAHVYILFNLGNGNFNFVEPSEIEERDWAVFDLGDVDGDGDVDIYYSGIRVNRTWNGLYLNNGNGVFTEVPINITPTSSGDAIFGDIDNDNDLDLVISGVDSLFIPHTEVYTNDGSGGFTLKSTLRSSISGDMKFADVDGDGDLDLFVSGSGYHSDLYLNDGAGNFTQGPAFPHGADVALEVGDFNGDGSPDLIMSGQSTCCTYFTKFYVNDGSGNFTEVTMPMVPDVTQGDIKLSDVNGDGALDLVITGKLSNEFPKYMQLFINDGHGLFLPVIISYFEPWRVSSAAFGDLDNDGDKDLLIMGDHGQPWLTDSQIYLNNGNAQFTRMTDDSWLIPLGYGKVSIKDFDGDGDNDILMSGGTYNQSIGRISKHTYFYRQDVSGNFAVDTGVGLIDKTYHFIFDMDGDGDIDIFQYDGADTLQKMINDGTAHFVSQPGTEFGSCPKRIYFQADLDGDSDKDLLMTIFEIGGDVTRLYLNDGMGNFIAAPLTFPSVVRTAAAGDIEGDGDIDFMAVIDYSLNLYINQGGGNFDVRTVSNTSNLMHTLHLIDLDLDGDLDILLSENSGLDKTIAFENNGSGYFSRVSQSGLPNIYATIIAIENLDNDLYPDLYVIGTNYCGLKMSNIYINRSQPNAIRDNISTAPVNLYPNPSKGIFYFDTGNRTIQHLKIYDITGRTVPYEFYPKSGLLKLQLPAGLYLVKVSLNEGEFTLKVLVE